jgi:2-hydroxy-3-keto-5-methylthiopentenyl-1-phosphate phosphatase
MESATLLTKEENSKNFAIALDGLLNQIEGNLVAVVDGDETLSKKDSSRIFWEINFGKESWEDLWKDFVQNGRDFNSYLRAAEKYSKIEAEEYVKLCEKTAKLIEIREEFEDLNKLVPSMIIVSSGIGLLWEKLIEQKGWANTYVVGGNHFSFDKYIVEPNIKTQLVVELKKMGKKVISFGDSSLDAQMLKNSDFGYVLVNERKSPGLAELVKGSEHIYQIKLEQKPIEGLPVCSFEDVKERVLGEKVSN